MTDTPRQLGRYELVRRIAVGGMGEIYLARTRGAAGFEKTVIIKKILPHLAEQEEFVDKFLDEGRIVVNLTHGNIVPVFDMDEVDGEYFIAMEYVPGRDLRDVMAELDDRDEAMPVELAAHIVSNACEGLAYAHRQTDEAGEPLDIVHRDVSPSNILLSTDGEIKIIDFGIARAADRRAETVTGRVQGKCCYMSPEQATGGAIDARSDIFSTGVVFYELVTGIRPFEGDSDLESLDLVRQCEFDPPSEVAEDVPEVVDDIVGRALQKDPDDRYQEISEMKVDLVEFLVDRGRAVTSEEVADFLHDLFPDGLERDEFQEAREHDTSAPKDLDEALEQQLDELGDSPVDGIDSADPPDTVDPMDATAPADGERRPRPGSPGRTETLTPETGVDEADDESTEPPPAADPNDESTDPDREATSPGETRPDEASVPSPRTVAVASAALLVAVGSTAAWLAFASPDRATVDVRSNPSGALLRVDGEALDDRTTPAEFRLAPGSHTLTLTKEDYESETVRLDLEAGETHRIGTELDPESEGRAPRTFQLRTEPEGSNLRVNQRPVGRAPASIRVAPGETKFVEATRQGCGAAETHVFYGRKDETVELSVDCRRADAGDAADSSDDARPAGENDEPKRVAAASPSPAPSASERQRERHITLRSSPSGAEVVVDDRKKGTTPVDQTFAGDAEVEIELDKSGYAPASFTLDVSEVEGDSVTRELERQKSGCLDFFAVRPQYNELAIDGEWLEGRHQKLQNYELSTGQHEIRVRNETADKDEKFEFEVEPGPECTSLTVWDPDEG